MMDGGRGRRFGATLEGDGTSSDSEDCDTEKHRGVRRREETQAGKRRSKVWDHLEGNQAQHNDRTQT